MALHHEDVNIEKAFTNLKPDEILAQIFPNTNSALHFKTYDELLASLEDLIERTCKNTQSPLDFFSALAVYFQLGGTCTTSIIENVGIWFQNFKSKFSNGEGLWPAFKATSGSPISKLKLLFACISYEPLFILFNKKMKEINDYWNIIFELLKGLDWNKSRPSDNEMVILAHASMQSLPGLDYQESLANYLREVDVSFI